MKRKISEMIGVLFMFLFEMSYTKQDLSFFSAQ